VHWHHTRLTRGLHCTLHSTYPKHITDLHIYTTTNIQRMTKFSIIYKRRKSREAIIHSLCVYSTSNYCAADDTAKRSKTQILLHLSPSSYSSLWLHYWLLVWPTQSVADFICLHCVIDYITNWLISQSFTTSISPLSCSFDTLIHMGRSFSCSVIPLPYNAWRL